MKNTPMVLNAVIVELNVSCWTARRHDKKASKEVTDTSGANSNDAARVHKNLMAGMDNLKKVTDFVALTRNEFYKMTLPWSDSGQRIIPMTGFFDLKEWVDDKELEFNSLVQQFLIDYPLLISAQAFQLGRLFERADYPTVSEIKDKFKFSVNFLPLPDAGDFRIDAPNEALQDMKQEYDRLVKERVSAATQHLEDRLREQLNRISERLEPDEKGGKKVFRNSLVDNAVDECDMIKRLNVTNDVKIEKARAGLDQALIGVDPNLLRESEGVRATVKQKVDSVLASWI